MKRFIFSNVTGLVWFSLVVFVFADLAFWLKRFPLNWDVAMYLQAGQLILKGQLPYRDFWELNPPLILYLNVLPAFLAEHLGIAIATVLPLVVGGFALLSLVLAGFSGYTRPWKRFAAMAAVYALLVWRSVVFRQFGQREELFAIAFIPYFLLRWFPTSRSARACLVALFLCSLMACLKPVFMLLLLASELLLRLRGRRLGRPSLGALAMPVLLYLTLFAFFPWDVTKAFFLEHVPFVLGRYPSVDDEWALVFALWKYYFFQVPLIAALLFWQGRGRGRTAAACRSLGLLILIAFSLAVMEKKAWGHHILITDALLCFGAALLVNSICEGKFGTPLWKGSLSALILLVFCTQFPANSADNPMSPLYFSLQDLKEKRLSSILSLAGPGEKVAIFSCEPSSIYPPLLEHRQWPGTRYSTMYPLCFFNRTPSRLESLSRGYPAFAELEPEEKVFVNRVKEDLLAMKPSLVIFPLRNSLLLPRWFNVFRYAKSVGWYDSIRDRYEKVFRSEDWLVLKIKEPGGPE